MHPQNQINLKIGSKSVGDSHPCFLVAEVGSNHNQDLDLAFRTIEAAGRAGVDAVKFQTFRAAQHISQKAPSFEYLKHADTYQLIRSLELDRKWHNQLKTKAEDCGMEFFSSACDEEAISELERLNVQAHKVASFDLTDDTLISSMASTGKALLLSTGMADWGDIQRAVATARARNNNRIVLLQCTSLYPAPAGLANLRAMASMRMAFGTLVGYSDHTLGDHIAVAAVSMGACVIEKHFTLNRNLPGPDHPFAIEPHEMKEFVKKIREVESGYGDGQKLGPRKEELEMARKGRRSLHAKVSIPAGVTICPDMLAIKRPGLGIAPSLREQVIGRVTKKNIEQDAWLTWDMF